MRKRRNEGFAVAVFWGVFLYSGFAQNLGDHAMEGFDHARTGLNTHTGDFRPPLKLVRTVELAGMGNAEQMLVFGNYLLVGEQDGKRRWKLFDRTSGETIWTHELPCNGNHLRYIPAYANDIVLLGGSTTTAVKAVRVSTGEELWKDSTVGDPSWMSPILTADLAIYGGDQKVVAADAVSGEVIWSFAGDIANHPVSLFGNRVYVASPRSLLHTLDLRTGTEIWTLDGETALEPSSNLIPTEQHLFLNAYDKEDSSGTALTLQARGSKDGALIWEKTQSPLLGNVLLANGRLFAPCDGLLRAVLNSYDATTGELLWSATEPGFDIAIGVPPPGTAIFFPMIANNVIYYLNGGLSHVRARDVFTGNCVWSIPVEDPSPPEEPHRYVRSISLAAESLFVLFKDSVLVYERSHEIFFPHIADGLSQSTHLALSNLSSESLNGTVGFYDDGGEPLELGVDGLSGVSQVEFTIPPGGSRRIETLGGDELRVGWARVDSNQPIAGSAIFQYSSDGQVLFEAGVSSAPVMGRTQVHMERLGPFSTGIAAANPIEDVAEISFTLSVEGEQIASTEMTLAPRGHLARMVEDLFPAVSSDEFVGTVMVGSDIPVVVTAVRTQKGYQMSSYPVNGPTR